MSDLFYDNYMPAQITPQLASFLGITNSVSVSKKYALDAINRYVSNNYLSMSNGLFTGDNTVLLNDKLVKLFNLDPKEMHVLTKNDIEKNFLAHFIPTSKNNVSYLKARAVFESDYRKEYSFGNCKISVTPYDMYHAKLLVKITQPPTVSCCDCKCHSPKSEMRVETYKYTNKPNTVLVEPTETIQKPENTMVYVYLLSFSNDYDVYYKEGDKNYHLEIKSRRIFDISRKLKYKMFGVEYTKEILENDAFWFCSREDNYEMRDGTHLVNICQPDVNNKVNENIKLNIEYLSDSVATLTAVDPFTGESLNLDNYEIIHASNCWERVRVIDNKAYLCCTGEYYIRGGDLKVHLKPLNAFEIKGTA